MRAENKANGLMTYRLSLFSFVVFITASLAWFIISAIQPRGAGATFGLLYPLAAFLLASAFNLLPLIGGLIQSLGKKHEPIARKAVWISIGSGLMPAFCIYMTFDNSPLLELARGLFAIYCWLAVGFAIILKVKRFDKHVV
jgi:heme exporter protein D